MNLDSTVANILALLAGLVFLFVVSFLLEHGYEKLVSKPVFDGLIPAITPKLQTALKPFQGWLVLLFALLISRLLHLDITEAFNNVSPLVSTNGTDVGVLLSSVATAILSMYIHDRLK